MGAAAAGRLFCAVEAKLNAKCRGSASSCPTAPLLHAVPCDGGRTARAGEPDRPPWTAQVRGCDPPPRPTINCAGLASTCCAHDSQSIRRQFLHEPDGEPPPTSPFHTCSQTRPRCRGVWPADDPEWHVVAEAVNAIGRHGDRSAIKPLCRRMSHGHPLVRKAAMAALVQLSPGEASRRLPDLLTGPMASVRYLAAKHLQRLRPTGILGDTRRALAAEEEPQVRVELEGLVRALAEAHQSAEN